MDIYSLFCKAFTNITTIASFFPIGCNLYLFHSLWCFKMYIEMLLRAQVALIHKNEHDIMSPFWGYSSRLESNFQYHTIIDMLGNI